jgi:hypothetical protein
MGPGASTGGSTGNPTGSGGSSTGGSPGSGSGGSSTGGSPGSGGSHTGGSTGSGGAATGGSTGSGGSSSAGSMFTVNFTPSTSVGTVEIVTWSISTSIDSAVINFGRDASNFEYQAPVDLKQASYRTLLLGMKQATNYSFQISATSGTKTYTSDVYMFKSGSLTNGLFPSFTKTDMSTASPLYANGGFTVNCIGLAGSAGVSTGLMGKTAPFIIDKDGDVVWGLDISSTAASNCSRARMSFDGQSMYAGNFANAATNGAIFAIPMDGMGSGTTWKLPGRSHDFGVLPNGHIMYFQTDNMMANTTPGGESVFDLDPSSGTSTKIYDEATDFASLIASGDPSDHTNPESHTNHIAFSTDLNAITVSMLIPDTIAVVSYPAGKLLATFGGAQTQYSNMAWIWQHGHDIHKDHIWVFNNNKSGPAHVLGFSYDSNAKTATPTLDYNPNIQNTTFGDVKEQPNGNLFITYSDSGTFHEITKTGTLLRKVTTTTAIGYSEHRSTMYGPPPPFATN